MFISPILKKHFCLFSLASSLLLAQQPLQQPLRHSITELNREIHSRPTNRLIEARATLLEQVIQSDPDRIAELLLSSEDAARLRKLLPDAAASIESSGPWEGELHILVEDDFEHGRSRTRWKITSPTASHELFFGKGLAPARTWKSGMQIRVQGIGIRGSIAVQQMVARAAPPLACSTTGSQNIAYLMATMPSAPSFPAGWTPSFIQQTAFGTSGVTLNSYWGESSYGKASATGGVFGPFALAQNYNCDQSGALESAILTAAAGTVNLSQYNRIAVVFPVSSCSYGGLATLGCETLPNSQLGSFAWFPIFPSQSPSTFVSVLAHEHGHNLGLDHSSTADYGNVPLGSLNDAGTQVEYGDPFTVMGLTQQAQGSTGILGQYAAEHKGRYLGWLQEGSDYREIKTSGLYTILPYESSSGIRALRVLRDPATDAWVWLEYRQPLGLIDSTLARLSTNVMNGALVHYENPNLDSAHTYQLDFTPTGTPNNFFDGALVSGQSWSDPVSPLRLSIVSAATTGMTVAVNYDVQCAAATVSSPGVITVTAPAGCIWSAATKDSWLSFTSSTTGQGNGTVTYSASANPGTTQRTGYITVQRNSIPVLQPGTATTAGASPSSGTGSSSNITFTFNDTRTGSYTDLSTVYVNFLGSPGCNIEVQTASNYAYLLNDAGTFYVPLSLASSASTVSNSQCTLFASGSSLSGSGQQLTLTLHVTFNSSFAGTHTILASATDAASTSYGPFPVGGWTVPQAIAKYNVGFFQPSNGPIWVLDANGNGTFDGTAGGDRYFAFAGQPGIIAFSGDWNGDGHSKVGYYLNGFWALDYDGDGVFTSADKFYAFGGSDPSYVPVIGDWNADGRTKVGYYHNGFWALDINGDGTFDSGDGFFALGGNGSGETPIVGDWNGDKRTKIGFYYRGGWVLDFNGDGTFNSGDKYYGGFPYAIGDKPVVGDWNYDGTTKIGVYRGGFWILDNNGDGLYQGGVDKFYAFSTNSGETPIVADWNGDGRSKVGVYFNGFWVLDYNGDGTYNNGDRFIAFGGAPGNQPLIGKW